MLQQDRTKRQGLYECPNVRSFTFSTSDKLSVKPFKNKKQHGKNKRNATRNNDLANGT